MQSIKSQPNTQRRFEEIPGELPADRQSRHARWLRAQKMHTESERIAVMQGLDPDAHLTRRELRAKRRLRRQRRRKTQQATTTPGQIVRVELVQRGG